MAFLKFAKLVAFCFWESVTISLPSYKTLQCIASAVDVEGLIFMIGKTLGYYQVRAMNYPLWERALEKAIAQGIYVSTCSREPISYLNLVLDFDKDPDDPASYAPTGWTKGATKDPNRFYAPSENRTVASHRGVEVYQLYREGGLSWSAPYLAGLAALAFQVRPDLSPADIVTLIKATAAPMPFGKIVNPRKLISEAKALKK